jgi:hypothetical protein
MAVGMVFYLIKRKPALTALAISLSTKRAAYLAWIVDGVDALFERSWCTIRYRRKNLQG